MKEENILNMEMIEDISVGYQKQKEVIVKINTNDGFKKAGLSIDVIFSPAKINLCVREYLIKIDYLRRYIKGYQDIESLLKCWLIFLIIKHFSSLDVPNEFKKQIVVLERMIESKLLFQIFAEYDAHEIEKVMNELGERTNHALKNIEELEDTFTNLEDHEKNFMEKINKIIEKK